MDEKAITGGQEDALASTASTTQGTKKGAARPPYAEMVLIALAVTGILATSGWYYLRPQTANPAPQLSGDQGRVPIIDAAGISASLVDGINTDPALAGYYGHAQDLGALVGKDIDMAARELSSRGFVVLRKEDVLAAPNAVDATVSVQKMVYRDAVAHAGIVRQNTVSDPSPAAVTAAPAASAGYPPAAPAVSSVTGGTDPAQTGRLP